MSDSECSLSRLAKSKKTEFTGVIEYFFDKRNADSGLYGQTLVKYRISRSKDTLDEVDLHIEFAIFNQRDINRN